MWSLYYAGRINRPARQSVILWFCTKIKIWALGNTLFQLDWTFRICKYVSQCQAKNALGIMFEKKEDSAFNGFFFIKTDILSKWNINMFLTIFTAFIQPGWFRQGMVLSLVYRQICEYKNTKFHFSCLKGKSRLTRSCF